ncbi:MAG: PASTA domain-containing protein [Pseudonocardiaceae bacterium]
MPDLVGLNLQEAQNTIQKLTDFGIAWTRSHDSTGAGRQQVWDQNWRVCSQNIPPGTTITTSTVIDFGTVKLSERC